MAEIPTIERDERVTQRGDTPMTPPATEVPQVMQEVPEAPVVEAPQVQQVEAPAVETPETPETPAIETPAPTEQETMKLEEQRMKLQEEQDRVWNQERLERLRSFRELMESGAKQEELADFVNQNQDLRAQLGISFKNFYKDQQTFNYQQKYATLSPESLYTSYIDGDIVVWSKEYNTLPAETRQGFEQYKAEQDLQMTPQQRNQSMENDANKVLSFDSYLAQFQGFYSTDIRQEYDKLTNSEEMNTQRSKVGNLRTEIEAIQIDMEDIRENVEEQYKGYSTAYRESKIQSETRRLQKELRTKNSQYQSELAIFSDMKSDVDRNLNFLQQENAQKQQVYTSALAQYNTDRARMDKFAILEFQRENQALAEQRMFQNKKSLIEFQNNLEKQKIKGTWKSLEDGEYFLRDDGSAEKVIDGKLIGRTAKKNITSSTFKNGDWTTTTLFRDNDTQEVAQIVKGIDGNTVYPWGTTTSGTDLRYLQGQYPWQAWAKNNNSAGITWHAASAGLKSEWEQNGVRFSEGTDRPAAEWGKYVNFPTIQDGLAAHAITLWRKQSSILNGLSQWVWTADIAQNQQYARDLYNESGIQKPITTPLNQLNEVELSNLMKAQIRRESPWLYSEMASKWWITDSGFNIPVKVESKEETQLRRQLSEDEWKFHKDIKADFEEEQVVKDFEKSLWETKNLITSLSKWDGAWDVAAIFQFMKTLDPTSVVRESEFALAADTAGIDDKLMTKFFKLKSGDRLPKETREKFTRLSLEYLKNRGESYTRKYNEAQADYNIQIPWQEFPVTNAVEEVNKIIEQVYGEKSIDDFLDAKMPWTKWQTEVESAQLDGIFWVQPLQTGAWSLNI